MNKDYFIGLNDFDLISVIKDPNTSELDYNKACEVLLNRYEKQIHKNWWTLLKQLNKAGRKTYEKEDYFGPAYEAFFIAIQKTDLSKVRDNNWKFVGMLNWYLTNVRTKIMKDVKEKDCKTKSLVNGALKENDESNVIDWDVEESYQNHSGYKNNPEYVFSIIEGSEICKKGIDKCMEMWTEDERQVFKLLESGESKVNTARILGIKPSKLYSMSRKMCKDLKEAIDYK